MNVDKAIQITSDEDLLQMLANTYATYCECGGHGKSAANKSRYEQFKKALTDRGLKIPSEEKLSEIGKFNGHGAC